MNDEYSRVHSRFYYFVSYDIIAKTPNNRTTVLSTSHRLHHQLRPFPRPFTPSGQGVEILPTHDSAKARIHVRQRRQGSGQVVERDPTMAVGRVGQDADDDLFGGPATADDGIVSGGIGEAAPVVVELDMVPGDAGGAGALEGRVVEAGQVAAAEQGGRDGREGDEEAGAEIRLEPIDQAHDAGQRHDLLDIQIQPVERERQRAQLVAQPAVVRLEPRRPRVQPRERARRRPAQHPQHLDPHVLHHARLRPQRRVLGCPRRVVVERDVAWRAVEVQRRDHQVRDPDPVRGFAQQRQHRDVVAAGPVVGLVVDHHARLVRGWGGWGGRHFLGCGLGCGGGVRGWGDVRLCLVLGTTSYVPQTLQKILLRITLVIRSILNIYV